MKKILSFILISCLFLLCSLTSNVQNNQADIVLDTPTMKIYNYFAESATEEVFDYGNHFEYLIYQLLKENPLKKEVNYLAFPWIKVKGPVGTGILFSDEKMAFIKQLRLDGGFTVAQYWKDEVDCPDKITLRMLSILKEIGITCVFTPDASKRKSYMGIQIEPLPFYVVCPVDPNCTKDILCSFVGRISHSIREPIRELSTMPGFVIKIRSRKDIRNKQKQEQFRKEYNDILARSRFSLSPRGFEPGSIRFWESLQAGAIPILIGNETRLPDGVNWKECIIHVSETEFEKNPKIIDDIIKTISPKQEKKMRTSCLEAYSFFSGENLVRTIREYYEDYEH